MPGDPGSISTLKPGLGVAQRTSTPEAEKEIAAVPPVSAKVWVVAAGEGGGGGGAVGAEVVGGVVVARCVVGAGCAVGAIVGLDAGWVVGVGFDGVAWVGGLEPSTSTLPGVFPGSLLCVDPGSPGEDSEWSAFSLLELAASLGVSATTSAAEGGSTT